MKKWDCKPNQMIKRVYGLRGVHAWEPGLVEFRIDLECLDAPEVLPAGSTWRAEHLDIELFEVKETVFLRDSDPYGGHRTWPQGGEYFHRKGV